MIVGQPPSPSRRFPSPPRRDRRLLRAPPRRRQSPALHLPAPLPRHPRGSYGPIDPGRLAILSGREPHAILRAFTELAPSAPRAPARRYAREDIQRNHAARREKYAAIRRDAGSGLSQRAIERKHHVGRRTIIRALASAEPPERKKIRREPAALHGLHGHIDAMIDADPKVATAVIWERLADEHGATVAYPTLRTYVTSRRISRKDARQVQRRQNRDDPHGRLHHPHSAPAVGTGARNSLRSRRG